MQEEAYKELIMAALKGQRTAGLPAELVSPTPGGIKALFLKAVEKDFNQRNESILISFIGKKEGKESYIRALENIKAHEFKSLVYFLNQTTDSTRLSNLELLALLIDFEPRPFQTGRDYEAMLAEQERSRQSSGTPVVPTPTSVHQPVNPGSPADRLLAKKMLSGRQTAVISVAVALIITAVAWFYLKDVSQAEAAEAVQDYRPVAAATDRYCMIWDTDHFRTIPYSQRPGNKLAYKIDSAELGNFKKIMNTDTLGDNSVGKVYYFKMTRDSTECFTDSGFHPVYPSRRLLKLSDGILKNIKAKAARRKLP